MLQKKDPVFQKPLLKERIKIKLRDQHIDFFDYYPPYEPPPLEDKQAFIPT